MSLFFFAASSASAYEFPPYQGLSLKIDGQVSESYSNNITFAAKDEDRVEDLLTNFMLGAALRYEGARRSMELSGFINRQMLTEKGTIQNSSERVTAIFRKEFTKYDRITISNTYIHTEVPGTLDEGFDREQCEQLFDLFGRDQAVRLYPECDKFEEEFGRISGRLDSFSNTVNVMYNKDLGERFNISTGYIFSQRWSPEEGTTDADQNIVRLTANYGLSAATIFLIGYSYENTRYDSGFKVDVQRVNAGFRQYITERLYMEGKAGMDFSSTDNDSTNIEFSLSGEIDKKTSARVTYTRGIEVTGETEDVFRNWRVSANASRQLSENLNASLSGFYGKGDFSSAEISDTFTGASFDASYRFWEDKLGKSINGRLGYTYSDLNSTDGERDYSRIGINAGLSVSF